MIELLQAFYDLQLGEYMFLDYDFFSCLVCFPQTNGPDSIFSPVWNQKKDILYVCMGPSFKANETLEIHAIPDVSSAARARRQPRLLTKGKFNNAFPFTNPDGKTLQLLLF
jgi:hypothetical protein